MAYSDDWFLSRNTGENAAGEREKGNLAAIQLAATRASYATLRAFGSPAVFGSFALLSSFAKPSVRGGGSSVL